MRDGTFDFAGLHKLSQDALRDFIGFEFEVPRSGTYPPYNIIRTSDDTFEIEMAVAGFPPDRIEIMAQEGQLSVTGRPPEEEQRSYLHRGISSRAFERKFTLDKHVVVDGADHADGMLRVFLRRVLPDALKPRKIEIGQSKGPRQVLMESPRAA